MPNSTARLVTISFLEDLTIKILYVIIPLYILQITGSAMDLAVARAIEFIPNITLPLLIGYYVDKSRDKGRIIILASCLQTISLLLLCISIYYDAGVVAIYTFLFAFTVFTYAFFNTHIVLTKMLINNNEIVSINSTYSLFSTFSYLIAPLLISWMLINGSYISVIILSMCLSITLSIYCLLYLRATQNAPVVKKQLSSFSDNLRQSIGILWNNKILLHLTIFTMMINAYEVMAFTNHFVYFHNTLGLDDSEISILLFFFALGSIFAAKFGESIFKKIPLAIAIIITVVSSSICYLLLPQVDSYYWIAVILIIEGFMACINGILIWSHRQQVVDAEVLGSLAAITGSIYKLLMPFSLVLGAMIVGQYESRYVYYLASIIALVSSIIYFTFFLRSKSYGPCNPN